MSNLPNWKITQRYNAKEEFVEGIKTTPASTFRYMWPYQASIPQWQEVHSKFIDDYSRKTWIYFLHEKSEAFITFKHFKANVKKEIGAFITCLRTDRGGEFTSNEFGEFCKS